VQDPIQKLARAERAGDMAQVVECLTGKMEALSSNSSRKEGGKEGREGGREGGREEINAGHGGSCL
jgi:hypothetical protein